MDTAARMQQHKLTEGLARLRALQANLPTGFLVSEPYVTEFHMALDVLEKSSGADLSGYRIPENILNKTAEHKDTLTGEVTYSRERQCDRNFLKFRIDTVMGFFQFVTFRLTP